MIRIRVKYFILLCISLSDCMITTLIKSSFIELCSIICNGELNMKRICMKDANINFVLWRGYGISNNNYLDFAELYRIMVR